ncbi:putative MFS family arabinose efflux permease [Nocardioides albertanoniae]|uniref:Putative MFS family arabinose efflux permease n=1 Tax=Nocardioides albertanoniae TaxID=1175486 RepID=A0A543A930_9ACTN|nr:MFS transporter [Nocardioides albertanoniae]TQL69117.1 putative MFS family arabinose efflux permease [Nocardioides albertanoniae]
MKAILWLGAIAVAFAAADTYVVVLALPDMMAGVGLSIEELQRAAPLISGFLLGYVAVLPLIGRLADLFGHLPVLVGGLIVFAFGSFLTALSWDLAAMVVGRFFQGLGGGALVPATLALVAALYPVERRGVPLGLVSAVQELGSVLGPLIGATVLALADWRAIFLLNLVVGVVLAVAIRQLGRSERAGRPDREGRAGRGLPDLVALALLLLAGAAFMLLAIEPTALVQDLTWGALYVPAAGSTRWLTPLGLITIVATVGFVATWGLRPGVRSVLRRIAAEVDLLGALLLSIALAGVILAFATADPEVAVFSEQGVWYLVAAGLALLGLVVHLRRAPDPIVPRGAFTRSPAWGSVLVSFFVGAALVAALIDVPLFARTTIYGESQLKAALVLLEFLVALPVGAIAGGFLLRRLPAGVIAGGGMLLAAVAFGFMARWDADALRSMSATVVLVAGGLGFGLALAPINAAILATTEQSMHGLTTSFTVVARMVGMLVGISALTTIGLRSYYSAQADLPSLSDVCTGGGMCAEYQDLLVGAAIAQEHTVFAGAAVCAGIAALLSVVLLRGAQTRALTPSETVTAL